MKKLMIVLLVVLMATLVFAIPASAGPPVEVSGTLILIGSTPPVRKDVGGNCLVTFDGVLEFAGENASIVGQAESSWMIMAKRPCAGGFPGKSDESIVVKGTCIDCQVGERQGDFDFNFMSRIRQGGSFSTNVNIVKGYDGLANLHGTLKNTGVLVGESGYTGKIHFDP